jgi:uncharacterized protein (DUF983 family)
VSEAPSGPSTPGARPLDRRAAALAGLRGRCPVCGRGRLFSGFLKIAPRCTACGFDHGGENTGDGPAAFIILIAGFVVGFSALFVEMRFSPPIWVHLIVWLPMVAGLSLAMMQPLKGLMVALQIVNRASEVRNDEF